MLSNVVVVTLRPYRVPGYPPPAQRADVQGAEEPLLGPVAAPPEAPPHSANRVRPVQVNGPDPSTWHAKRW